jgi:3-oxoacyl-[acyl-carrier protein] reductase
MDLGMRGRVALVTGGGGGIGREVATILAREGVDVVVADLRPEPTRGTIDAVEGGGGSAIPITIDVTDNDSIREAVAIAEAWRGRIDILVNAAGIYHVGTYAEVTTASWDLVHGVNLRGTFLTCQAVLGGMVSRRRGAIVNLASISGRTRSTLAAPSYVASKAGIIGLTMSLAMQVAPSGVRVNAVAPGPTETEMIFGLPEELQAKVLATIPIGRLATTAEVASMIVFLASDLSGSTTGETVNINGGAFMV